MGVAGRAFGIVGLGVMGGSLSRALKHAGAERVVGFSPDPAETAAAIEAGAIDEGRDAARDTSSGVDWWILATPLAAVEHLLAEPGTPPRAGIMDVASLQGPPLAWADHLGRAAELISVHPMVGSERSGFEASRDDLYVGGRVWLSAHDDASQSLRDDAVSVWKALDAKPEWIDAGEHDERMVGASHLPQVVANALAAVMARRGVRPADLGPGGRDMTRLAASSPTMWTDLLASSGGEVATALRSVADELAALAELLDQGELGGLAARMEQTRAWRRL